MSRRIITSRKNHQLEGSPAAEGPPAERPPAAGSAYSSVLLLVAGTPTPIATVIAIALTITATMAIAAFTTATVAVFMHGLGDRSNDYFAA